jgi:hypothetical protein
MYVLLCLFGRKCQCVDGNDCASRDWVSQSGKRALERNLFLKTIGRKAPTGMREVWPSILVISELFKSPTNLNYYLCRCLSVVYSVYKGGGGLIVIQLMSPVCEIE